MDSTDAIKYTYQFGARPPMRQVQQSLALAVLSLEALFGATRVRLDARYEIDRTGRSIIIDAATETGERLNLLFVGFLRREYGDDAFRVTRRCATRDAAETAA